LLVAGLSYFVYRELQFDTRGFTINIHIPAKRADVFRKLFDEFAEFTKKIHPSCTDVTNIIRSQENGQRIVQFEIHQKLVIFGLFERSVSFHVTVKEIEENTTTQLTANPTGGMLQGMLHVNQGFRVTDAEDGGSLLEDHAEYTAPRILAIFARSVAHDEHTKITQNIKKHFLEVSQQA